MSHRSTRLAALTALVAACHEPVRDVPEALAGACPIDQPTRLVAAPPGFVADPDTWYGLHRFGDQLLFTFDALDDPGRVYWRLDRCDGELAEFPSLAPGLHNPFSIATPAGRVLYANDALGARHVVDRLDVAGDDEPRPVPGLPQGTALNFTGELSSPFATFAFRQEGSARVYLAAGLGGETRAIYTHAGDVDVPALLLGDAVVDYALLGDALLLHDDSGELRRVDPLTGASEPLLAGVRHFTPIRADPGKVLWQELGDDVAETIFLRDLATGADVAVAVNDFAQSSWFRDPEQPELGRVLVTADGSVAALPGPGGPLVAAARLDTGAALAVPAHREPRGSFGGEFNLVLADEPEHVEALWDPLTGALREWYRGPAGDLRLRRVDGDSVEYFATDPGTSYTGVLWRVDLATGARRQLVARASSSAARLADDRYFLAFYGRQLPGAPFDGSRHAGAYAYDLKLVDPSDGLYTTIAEGVTALASLSDEGLVYLAPHGDEPGVWAYPLALQ
ncbi:hypothetical protein [Nannocystis pusilla]|uniref:Lipoprotein n=1 Tax=Nannocystis pusilla TaxID=889268 RepID=A0ABS7U2L3_9BACT|nr:hypothetical protein [Nannocystis pusilla]MBZ5714556.1 hypothetical protein [Nannocystis pusilla]